MSERGRAALSGLAVAVLFALPLLAEILGARRLVFRDAQVTHWPWRRVAAASLAAGEVPFVNASASGGEPLLANPNAVLLYPTVLLEKAVAPAAAFNLHYLLHVLWACFGARRLARALGQSEGAAFFSGVAYAFSGAMLSYASGFANSSAAAAWLPWCGAAAVALARAREARDLLRPAAALALALGVQLLAGEPAISALTLGACAVGGTALAGRTRGALGLGRFLLAGGAAAVAAAALAAPLLLPLRDIAGLTYRGQHVYSLRAFGAAPFALWRLPEWLFPRWSGDPGLLGAGGHWQYAWHPGDIVYLWSVTLGVLPLVVLVLGGISPGFWNRTTAFLAVGAAAGILFAFGPALPFWRALGDVEALRRLRYPIKFYLPATAAIALLAGFALDRLAARGIRRREIVTLAAVAVVFVLAFFAAREGGALEGLVRPAVSGLAVSPDRLLPAIRRTLAGDAAFGIVAVAAIALVRLRGAAPPVPGYLLGLAALVLALPWALPLFVSADEKDLERPPALAEALQGPGRLYVSPLLPEFNVMAGGTAHPEMPPLVSRLARVQIEELIPATGAPFGIRYLFDGDPDGSYGWYNRLTNEALTVASPEDRVRLLRAYSGRWILADEKESYPETRVVTGLTVAGRRLVLREIASPLPELRWAGRARYRRGLSGAIAAVKSPAFDPSREVVLPGAADREDGEGAGARLRIETATAASAAATVQADGAGFLVFSRTFFAAWKATVDGRPARVSVANARDLAVPIPAGAHRVALAWDEGPFRRGVALQAAAVLLLAAVPLVRARSRSRAR